MPIILLAAVLILPLLVGCGDAGDDGRGTGPEPVSADAAAYEEYALSLYESPERAPYPDEADFEGPDGEFDNEAYDEAWQAWNDDQTDTELTAASRDALDAFFASAVPFLLPEDEETNFVCSPVNIYMALSLLAEVTDGNSRTQILDALGVSDVEALRQLNAELWDALPRDDGRSALLFGNSLWLSDRRTYRQETADLAADRYHASVFSGPAGEPDYDAALRAWVDAQTRGLLTDQSQGLSLDPETVLAIASTIYFKAGWLEEFEEALTREDVFHAASGDETAEFMHQTERMAYAESDGLAAAGLRLNDGSMMWFFLPDEGTPADALLADGAAGQLRTVMENAEYRRVDLALPKFDADADLDLTACMRQLGITDVFDDTLADFSPLTDDADQMEVSSAEHAARVKIDEEGVEAAAFTVIAVSATGMIEEEEPVVFVLDRPFAFAVEDGQGAILFAGVVNTAE